MHRLGLSLAIFALSFVSVAAQDISFRDMDEDQRRDWIIAQAETYEIRTTDPDDVAKLQEPVLRFNDNISGVVDALQFVWTVNGRPEVAASLWFRKDGLKTHEFVTLSRGPLETRSKNGLVWQPSQTGFEFKSVPGAQAPSASKVARLAQMRQIARRCKAWETLNQQDFAIRLMPQPLFRYETDSKEILDGAIFSYAKGTNPELLLIVEAIASDDSKAKYQYSCARMTSRPCWLLMDDKEVWRVRWNSGFNESSRYRNLEEYETAVPKAAQ